MKYMALFSITFSPLLIQAPKLSATLLVFCLPKNVPMGFVPSF